MLYVLFLLLKRLPLVIQGFGLPQKVVATLHLLLELLKLFIEEYFAPLVFLRNLVLFSSDKVQSVKYLIKGI